MNVKLKIRVSARVLSLVVLGVSQPALPMSLDVASHGAVGEVIPVFSKEELELLVGRHAGGQKYVNLAYLDQKEMERTEGRVGVVGGVVGGIGGLTGYVGTTIGSGNGSVAGMVGATLAGAIGGFLAGPSGQIAANSILASQVGFYGGLAGGLVERAANSCSSCHSVRSK